ncbi:N-acyl-phosphatidylethanolamine-hydrolyzing phospholipase D [Biomphalaria glabrata]|nr:N-acyl-phosphatidylethanolamine-hydrolyzing phospholipase D [Biomphalaria glabrata]
MSQDLIKPKRNGEQFISPWEVWTVSFTKLFRFLFLTRSEGNNPQNEPLDTMLPVIKDDLSKLNTQPALGIRHMWVGHATSLLQFDGVTFLTDPIFSDYCSPLRMLGPRRYRPPPCTVQDLPHIDFVLISHNHYDHLDYSTVVQLNDRFGDNLTWYVPLGLKQWMNDSGCNNVIEMNWWEEHTISGKDVRVICTPCQHWCRRGIWDTNKVLWCSWCVIGPKSKFYFAGDTGYCDVFKTIGKHYGPFDLATIPIGAYNPRWMLAYQHVDPEEAIKIHIDVKASHSIGIHWGTFPMGAKEFYLEPRTKLEQLMKEKEMDPSKFCTVPHGKIITIGEDAMT